MEKVQNYKNHAQFVPLFHYFLFGLIILIFIGSITNLIKSAGTSAFLGSILVLAISNSLFFFFAYCRIFPLKAQDRAIRAEENLRHYVLTGKLFDPRLRIGQIIALRFAPDEEFIILAPKAVTENLSSSQIKQAIKNWKADTYRV
ncbi:MAG: DUF6526 family protein [Planctomycetota bacterium]